MNDNIYEVTRAISQISLAVIFIVLAAGSIVTLIKYIKS